MSHTGQHPVCAACDRHSTRMERMLRRAALAVVATRQGFPPGTREHSHRVSRLDGDRYDCGCAGCRGLEEPRP